MAIAQTLFDLIFPFFDLSSTQSVDTQFVRMISIFLTFLILLVPFYVVYKVITLFLK